MDVHPVVQPQEEAPRSADRHGLFMGWVPGTVCTRHQLVPIARSGFRGLRVQGFMKLDSKSPEAAAHHLAFLREAAGVGLRVAWRGQLEGIITDPFHHLDPPRDQQGSAAWPVPRRPLLTLRRGPGFVLVEDHRQAATERTLIEDPDQVRALTDPQYGCVADERLTRDQSAAVRALADAGLFAAIGAVWTALPVRFRYARA
ncbi:DUF5825 family protein [Streptomyces anulatus]|uniref:DUF5825 family protein n=1 Tax=Streptomyces anulatus TaxID=1892 RepID=UPI0012FF02FE|nr:DUF5825 family protein [Streptomyces anulatus]